MSERAKPHYLIGIDIGGTKSAAILGRSQNHEVEILGRTAFLTDPQNQSAEQTLDRLQSAARNLLVLSLIHI